MSKTAPITAHCLCGLVGYSIAGPVSGIVLCHCSMCRKAAGGGSGFFVARRKDVTWHNEARLTLYESSPGLLRSFCPRCGTAMTGANPITKSTTIILAANSLDDTTPMHVAVQEYHASRAAWADGIEKAPCHEGAFPDWDKLNP